MQYKRLVPYIFIALLAFVLGFCAHHFWEHRAKPKKPVIGILMNAGSDASYSIYPWYAIRKNYSDIVIKHGGVPVFIGHDYAAIDQYLELVDGLVLTGGDFGTSEGAYTTGIKALPDAKLYPRERMELELIQKAYKKDIPVIGTCAGMQEMNLALGGTLYENLMRDFGTTRQHRIEDRAHTQHSIQISPDSQLARIMKNASIEVNSNHKAGIHRVAEAFTVTAVAPDGVIEAFEAPNKRFFVGVMWHPEFELSDAEVALWQAFISEAAQT